MIKFILICLLVASVYSAECHGSPGEYYTNSLPIWKESPRLLKVHPYGKLYEIGSDSNKLKLLHVYGNMYQMGFAHGQLLKQDLQKMTKEVWAYLQKQFQDTIPKKVPAFLKLPTSGLILGAALDLTYEITRAFTNQKYYQQMHGIADGSGAPFKIIKRIHMIGELTKGSCSMFGAWGSATPNGKAIQLRALDWDLNGPFRQYPLITVYHPSNPKDGNSWLNVGFYGWAGVVSGVNQNRLAVSEIGVYFSDETFGKQSRFGNPFTFVLRDILQWDHSLNESIQRLQKTKRTCNLIMGVGDGNSNSFRGFQYSHSVLNVVNDTHPLPKNDTWHPAIQNVVYYGMDWLCPHYHTRLHEMLTRYYGNITVENTIRSIIPGLNSGNLQAVVYDLAEEWIYFSYGANDGHTKTEAYKRPFIGLDLKKLFSEKNVI